MAKLKDAMAEEDERAEEGLRDKKGAGEANERQGRGEKGGGG